jgi:hypothetical protein
VEKVSGNFVPVKFCQTGGWAGKSHTRRSHMETIGYLSGPGAKITGKDSVWQATDEHQGRNMVMHHPAYSTVLQFSQKQMSAHKTAEHET